MGILKKFHLLTFVILVIILSGCSTKEDITNISSSVGQRQLLSTPSEVSSNTLDSDAIKSDKDYTVRIKNQTKLELLDLSISENKEEKWSASFINESKTLTNGSSSLITFKSISKNKLYDIKALDKDQKEYVWERLNLSSISEVTLYIEDYIPTATYK